MAALVLDASIADWSLGLVALFLSSIGVYAVMAHEIVVRMALGARRKNVLSPGTGSYQHWNSDRIAGNLLAAAAMLAYYIPARRAARVDPMVTLRTE